MSIVSVDNGNGETSGLKNAGTLADPSLPVSDKTRPAHPSQNYNYEFNPDAGVNGGDILFNSPDVQGASVFSFENRSAGAISIFATLDGAINANQPAQKVALTDSITGDTVTVTVIPANKTGIFTRKIKNFQVQQSGATGVPANEVVSSWGSL